MEASLPTLKFHVHSRASSSVNNFTVIKTPSFINWWAIDYYFVLPPKAPGFYAISLDTFYLADNEYISLPSELRDALFRGYVV